LLWMRQLTVVLFYDEIPHKRKFWKTWI